MDKDLKDEYALEQGDNKTIERIMSVVIEKGISRDEGFEDRVRATVGRLHDEGIVLGDFIGSSRRVAFEGRYLGHKVAIKFSHSKLTLDHDERQQQREETIWLQAVLEKIEVLNYLFNVAR